MKEVVKKHNTRSQSETRNAEEGGEENETVSSKLPPMSPLEIKMYTSKTLPKRIEKIKKNREKKETARFYTDLDDNEITKVENENELKIVEPSDDASDKPFDVLFERRDSDIIKSILVQSELANRRNQKGGMSRRKSFEQIDQGSPLSRRKLEEALEAIKFENQSSAKDSLQISPLSQKTHEEPLYEELLRNVHVPYKFAPPMLKRSQSVSSANDSIKEISCKTPDKIQALSTQTINDVDDVESELDYVTLTYSNDKLEAIDGVFVTQNSPKSNNSSTQLNNNSSCDDFKQSCSEINLKPAKSFLHKFMKSPSHDEDTKSVSLSSRKSFDGGLNSSWKSMIYKSSTTDISTVFGTPPIYRQGSEDLGSRIANVDYADPKKLFASNTNILINKSSLFKQRDSVVSSSSDSIMHDAQKNLQQQQDDPFSDSYYEDTAESVLESKDFRDSAIYSDDYEKRSDATPCNDDVYASVHKKAPTPTAKPALPKKPSLLLKPNFTSRPSSLVSSPPPIPPPIPCKPSSLKSPEIRNAIFNYRKGNFHSSEEEKSSQAMSPKEGSNQPGNWVKQQLGKFQ